MQALAQEVQPVRLLIPRLEIDAPIEAVGQDADERMAAPSTVEQVAWYSSTCQWHRNKWGQKFCLNTTHAAGLRSLRVGGMARGFCP
jgi:hypothetical protein